jgi:two-component system, sporulation sensor kinase D
MFDDWFYSFVEKYEEIILHAWSKEMQEHYNDLYPLEDMEKSGRVYFKLLTDLDIAIHDHPLYSYIIKSGAYLNKNETPLQYILHSTQIWRDTTLKYLWEYAEMHEIPVSRLKLVNPKIHKRIDIIQRYILSLYIQNSNELIEQRDKTIHELHNDRLTMLGKMASVMAHELRNPLFAIQGFIQLIHKNLPPNSTKEMELYIDVIEREFDGLYRQINSFLSFSKNGNELSEPFSECSCHELIESIFDLMKSQFLDQDIQYEFLLALDFHLTIQKTSIKQVIMNLINNSMDSLSTVSHKKNITIHGYEDESNYYISVTDNGPGIPEGLKDSIFEPFISHKTGGTGLGLSVCRQIMKKNKGEITFSSNETLTTFTLSFPKDGII